MKSPACIACEYGPIAAGAFSVLIAFTIKNASLTFIYLGVFAFLLNHTIFFFSIVYFPVIHSTRSLMHLCMPSRHVHSKYLHNMRHTAWLHHDNMYMFRDPHHTFFVKNQSLFPANIFPHFSPHNQ